MPADAANPPQARARRGAPGSSRDGLHGLPPGFHRLIAAQFTSALADNALLIVAIALLHEQGRPGWWAPLLKFGFTLSYVVFAPVVGPLADALPKARLMAWTNGIKIVGLLALLGGAHPLLGFSIAGLGAAAYAPAKYGLVTEMVGPRRLVAANGWIEVSVVCAALFGTVAGGALVADRLRHGGWGRAASEGLSALTGAPAASLVLSMLLLLAVYGLAALLNVGIPDSGARYPRACRHPGVLVAEFRAANRTLWRDADGGLSLAVTTVFWGVGATLQLAVLRWAADALGLRLEHAAYLQAAVADGVVAGAPIAGRCVGLPDARRVLPAGIVLGLLMAAVAATDRLALALPLLATVGLVGGILVVPLNALLQHRGHVLLSAGRSIAVQGFNENLGVLGMLALYAGLLALDLPIGQLMVGFGLAIAAFVATLTGRERGRRRAAGVARWASDP